MPTRSGIFHGMDWSGGEARATHWHGGNLRITARDNTNVARSKKGANWRLFCKQQSFSAFCP